MKREFKVTTLDKLQSLHRVRLLTNPYKFYMIPTSDGRVIKACLGAGKDPLLAKGGKPIEHWALGIMDWNTGSLKILDIDASFYQKLQKVYLTHQRQNQKAIFESHDIVIANADGFRYVLPLDHEGRKIDINADVMQRLEKQLEEMSTPRDEEKLLKKPRKKRVVKPSLPAQYTCQNCLKKDKSTHHRSIYTKDYVGPCGDSFCFASCDMSACRPVSLTVCDDCAKKLSK